MRGMGDTGDITSKWVELFHLQLHLALEVHYRKIAKRGGSFGKKRPALIGADPGHMGRWLAVIGPDQVLGPTSQFCSSIRTQKMDYYI